MKNDLKICQYNDLLTDNEELNELMNEYIVVSCLNIANNAQFKTDYFDVKDHIFGNSDYIKMFVIEEGKKIPNIKAFLIADLINGYNDNTILHCHGIIVDPSIQGLGVGRELINYLIEKYAPDIVTAKTHNPRCFNTLINANGIIKYYPNEGMVPNDIYELVKSNPFISCVDENLIYVNAYPDEKIQQDYRNNLIRNIFAKVKTNDAQAVVGVINDSKLDLENKKLVKR